MRDRRNAARFFWTRPIVATAMSGQATLLTLCCTPLRRGRVGSRCGTGDWECAVLQRSE